LFPATLTLALFLPVPPEVDWETFGVSKFAGELVCELPDADTDV
jgi:hypothetical protein